MNRRHGQLIVWVLLLGALNLAGRVTADRPVRLASEVDVSSASIALSDLLSPDAPEELRTAASAIALGSAPEPGAVRRIARMEIDQALSDDSQLRAEIVVPDEIAVRRAAHRVTSSQIAAAIRTALGPDSSIALSKAGELLREPIYFSGDDPGLTISQIQFDPLHRVTRLKLWTSKEPENLPFFVTIPGRLKVPADLAIDGDTNDRSSIPAAGPAGFSQGPVGVRRGFRSTEKLVKTGVESSLVIEGSDYRITSTVIPLEAGALGDQIRVRDPVRRRVLTAQVVGPGMLRGTL